MKAVAIVELPDYLFDDKILADVTIYPMGYPSVTSNIRTEIKPMPKKETTAFNGYNTYIKHYEEGWNDCIGTILGEFDIEDGDTE